MKLSAVFATILSLCLAASTAAQASGQESSAIQAQIDLNERAIGRAIATRDFAALDRFWSPAMVVNSPTNQIASCAQVIESMRHGGLRYTSLKGTTEYFAVINGVAIKMSHENVVMADGPMAGKPIVRRSTDVWQKIGDSWVQIARQATYIGFDGAMLAGPAKDAYSAPSPTSETIAIQKKIQANNQAVGHAIGTMNFAALGKLWSPAMVVNSPGNNILTRAQVFEAMREEKLKYSSVKGTAEAFFVSQDLAIEMGHEVIVMANGPMAGKELIRRYTDVWQKAGDGYVQIARQATYIGIDGGAVYGHPA